MADFRYFTGKQRIVEDVKGFKTPVYRLKKKLVEATYRGTKILEISPKQYHIREVVLAISKVTGCPPNELLNKRRSHLTQPFRTLLYLICREKNLAAIYRDRRNALNRDHTTIVQGAKRGKLLIKKSRKMRKVYDDIIKELDVA